MPMLREIEAYCKTHKLSSTRFGREAVNDPGLIEKLNDGRKLRSTTAAKIRLFMAMPRVS